MFKIFEINITFLFIKNKYVPIKYHGTNKNFQNLCVTDTDVSHL